MTGELEPPPAPSLRDHVRTGIDVAVAAIPGVGGPLQVLLDAVLLPSLDKRRNAWLMKLQELVNELSEKVDGFDVETLVHDEPFVTAVIDASRIAMGTHLEAKLNLLKNCLAHMAVDDPRDDFLDLKFFAYVDELAPEHFVVLQYGQNPGAWFDAKHLSRPSFHTSGHRHLIDRARLPVTGPALEIVLRDLSDRGLADTRGFNATVSAQTVWAGWSTPLGDQLLDFISEI
ncbi:MAG TPA: hypothetical protein VK925_07715 [Jiangellaceae bacterium]|nr:hypothetical protein [Jiangellaceae bacterium]